MRLLVLDTINAGVWPTYSAAWPRSVETRISCHTFYRPCKTKAASVTSSAFH